MGSQDTEFDENLNSFIPRDQDISSPLTLLTSCSSPSPDPPSNMDIIKDQIRLLMEGRPFEELHEFCDFSIAEQNEAAASKGVQPGTPSDFVPVVKKSVCYIVAAVIFNEKNEVLMMQEAKSSCAGQWYLPAGRLISRRCFLLRQRPEAGTDLLLLDQCLGVNS